MVTAICLVLAYPVAFWLSRAGRVGLAVGMFALLLPFWTSVLVRTYAWLVLLGRNGVINRALRDWGWIETPLPLLHNTTGVLVGMVHVLLPYMVFPIYAALLRIDPDLSRAAEGLGAPAWRSFLRVTFPLSLTGVSAGCALVFVLSLGFFITPALLGGGRVVMVSMVIEQQVREFLDWPFAAALSTVLLVATLAIYALIGRLTRGSRLATP
jgi:ABC-type spermidine/putrescine transport system permease subunit I